MDMIKLNKRIKPARYCFRYTNIKYSKQDRPERISNIVFEFAIWQKNVLRLEQDARRLQ